MPYENLPDDSLLLILYHFSQNVTFDTQPMNTPTPRDVRSRVNNYMHTYNTIRPHASLGGLTPDAFCQQPINHQAA